jgi:hypothetical protein
VLDGLRTVLEEKQRKGVRQIRISTVLSLYDDAVRAEQEKATNGRRPRGRGRITPDDLLGAVEVARLLNVDRTRPSKWMKKGTRFGPKRVLFPEPFRRLESGPVWLRADVEKMIPFVEERRRIHSDDE